MSDIHVIQPQRLSSELVSQNLSFFPDTFDFIWSTRAPGNRDQVRSPTSSFTEVPLTKAERSSAKEAERVEKSKQPSEIKVSDLRMTLQQLIDQQFPIHPSTAGFPAEIGPQILEQIQTQQSLKGWVNTNPISREDNVVQLFGLDCEMCDALSGKVVTRVTLVRRDGTVAFDKLVKPQEKIIDYLTRFSGITEAMLEGVETSLQDIQALFLDTVSSTDWLVGHSLESDLNVLNIRHPKIVDTSMIYQHPRGLPYKPSLRWLTTKHLKREIQTGTNGHDSVEDAQACIDLVWVKLQNGLEYGTNRKSSISIAKRLAEAALPKSTAIADYGLPNWHLDSNQSLTSCTDDDEVVKSVINYSQNTDFTWGRLRDLEFVLGWAGSSEEKPTDPSEDRVSEALSKLNSRLKRLYDGLPDSTALIIWTGTGDPRDMAALKRQRKKFQDEYRLKKWDEIETPWTDDHNQRLKVAVDKAKLGLSFMTVKQPNSNKRVSDQDADKDNKRRKVSLE